MKWQKLSKAPKEMFRGSAVSDTKMAYFNSRNSEQIHSYDPETQEWDQLPDTPHIKHTLVIVNNMLTIVGGYDPTEGKVFNSILSLIGEGKDRVWLPFFPAMPSNRCNTAAICSGHSLIVAGGFDIVNILTTVEVLDTDTHQCTWTTASPLPRRLSSATASICGGNLYMLGGYEIPDDLPVRLVLNALSLNYLKLANHIQKK